VNTKQRLQTTRRKLNLLQTLLTFSFTQQNKSGHVWGYGEQQDGCIDSKLDATTGAFECQSARVQSSAILPQSHLIHTGL
jgi:hypothetical protein